MEGRLFTFFGSIGGHSQEWIVLSHYALVIAIVFFVVNAATKKMTLVPTGAQNTMEAFIGGIIAMGADTMGEKNARTYLPLIGSFALVIVICNVMGVIPGFESPTANINVTLGFALIIFIYYNYVGIKLNGFINYFKHFMGPMAILAPLMFPIEIISHLSRIVSLSFRLFGAVRGDDMFLMVLLMLVPWLLPLAGFFLLTIMGLLQAFIFAILSYVYIAGSVMMAEEEH